MGADYGTTVSVRWFNPTVNCRAVGEAGKGALIGVNIVVLIAVKNRSDSELVVPDTV